MASNQNEPDKRPEIDAPKKTSGQTPGEKKPNTQPKSRASGSTAKKPAQKSAETKTGVAKKTRSTKKTTRTSAASSTKAPAKKKMPTPSPVETIETPPPSITPEPPQQVTPEAVTESLSDTQQTIHEDKPRDKAPVEPSIRETADTVDADSHHWQHSLWRFFGILVFGFISYLVLIVAWTCSALQFVVILVQREPSQRIGHLMDQINAYMGQILDYLAGRTDATDLPFPLGPLPEPHIKMDKTSETDHNPTNH